MSSLNILKNIFKFGKNKAKEKYTRISGTVYFDDVKNDMQSTENLLEITMPLYQAYEIGEEKYKKDYQLLEDIMSKKKDLTLVLDCGNETEIKSDCLSFFNYYDKGQSIPCIRNIRVIGPNVEQVHDWVLSYLVHLEKIDLSSLVSVKSIGSGFLGGSKSLTHVDLSSFRDVQSVGDNFLCGCESLRKVDVSPLSQLKKLHMAFLAGCHSLEELDLSSFSNLKIIDECFLLECDKMRLVTLPHKVKMVEKLSNNMVVKTL